MVECEERYGTMNYSLSSPVEALYWSQHKKHNQNGYEEGNDRGRDSPKDGCEEVRVPPAELPPT